MGGSRWFVLWAKAGAAVALAFFVSIAHAHYDGDVSQPQHIYLSGGSAATYQKTAQAACQQRVAINGSGWTFVSVTWNSSAKTFTCNMMLGTAPQTTTIQEAHCDGWQRGFETSGATIVSSCLVRTDSCAISAHEHTETWDTNRTPFGFNVPDQEGLPPPWDTYRGCSFKLQSFTPNGNCTRVNYTGTGAHGIDEDAGPGQLASHQGNPYSFSVPPDCDPATGDTTSNDAQPSSTTCAQRAGNTTQIGFEYDDETYPTPPDPPAWSCIRGCKAVPSTSGNSGAVSSVCLYDSGNGVADGSCAVDYRFPFEDQPNYGICVNGTEAPSLYTPRGDGEPGAGTENPGSGTDGGGGGGTDMSGVEDGLDGIRDALTECDVSRGDICGPGDVSGELEKGEPGLDAMDGVAEDGMGQAEAGALDDDAPSWAEPLGGWASGAGAGCTAHDLHIVGETASIDLCEWAEKTRSVLYFVFSLGAGFHLFGCWRRASEV